MIDVIKKAKFRIFIHDLTTRQARSITLYNAEGKTIDDIKQMAIDCFKEAEEEE